MKIYKTYLLCALFSLLAVAQASAQSIVGAWSGSDTETTKEGAAVFVFLANGSFYYIENVAKSEAPGGFPGFERGTYTWNPTTGAITFNTVQDLNGNTGIGDANGRSELKLIVSGNTGTFIVPGGGGGGSGMRVTGTSPIVGAWSLGNAAIADSSVVIVFLPNGVYFLAQDGVTDSGGHDGIEHGTYSWNPTTGALTSSRTPAPYVDTNGDWGLSDPGGSQPFTFNVSADGLTLTGHEGTNTFSLARVGAASTPGPSPGAPSSLENPQPGSFHSGIALFSGWSCEGPAIGVGIDGGTPRTVPYGSGRLDTASVCGAGNVNTGFGLLFNFNLLGAGLHAAQLFVNGAARGNPVQFNVVVPAGEFLAGASSEVAVPNFPTPGRTTVLIWQQSEQNFAIKSVSP